MRKGFWGFMIYLLIGWVIMMSGCQEKLTTKVVESHENGQPSVIQYVDKNQISLREAHYYEDGALMMEGPLKDGKRQGEWKAYFPDGKLQSTGFFEQGKRTGPSKVFWSSGNLYMEGDYNDGRRVGLWKYYDEQGYLTDEVELGD